MDQVEEVKQKSDIVAVIGERVKLNKAGRHFRGLCPFHEERTPSFMVSPELQIYKCFGCGESGDIFTFLERVEGMEFPEALRYLADKAGIKLKAYRGQDTSVKAQIIEANKLASKFYNYLLTKHKLGEPGRQYAKKRGLAKETIDTFKIGFAPKKTDILFSVLTKKKKISPTILEQAGLVFKTQRGYMDRFRERLVFPITNHRGEVVALAGRILPEYDTGRVGKYINSPETPVYHKSSSLYGLDITKQDIRKAKTAIVVEGELDFLSSYQAGVKNVVAIKGTALTMEHVRILARFAETLIMALDSDFAGDTAAIRGLSFAQNAGLEIKVVKLGDHKDPDEFAKADPDGYKAAIKNAVDAWEFVINVVAKRYNLATGSGKSKASKHLMPVLATIEDNIVKSHYLQKAASKLGVPLSAVIDETAKYQKEKKDGKPATVRQKTRKSRQELLEEELLILSLEIPSSLVEEQDFDFIDTPWIRRVLGELRQYSLENEKFEIASFSQALSTELSDNFATLVLGSDDAEYQDPGQELVEVKLQLKELGLKRKISNITKLIEQAEEGGTGDLDALQKEFLRFSEQLAHLEAGA